MTTPYRDDREALRERLASLEAELARVHETLKTLGDEERAAATLEAEIARVRAQLEDRTKLEDLRIAAPCSADWNAMEGDERVRFCGTCQKNVYDLSKMSRAEAERLVSAHEGPAPCVRLYKRRDGTVITNDCPVGRKRRRLRRVVAVGVGGALLATGAMMTMTRRMGACSKTSFQGSVGNGASQDIEVIAGGIDRPPPPGGAVVIRELTFAGVDDVANARSVLAGAEPALRECILPEAATGSVPMNGATARLKIELAHDGKVAAVIPGLATMPPPTVDCLEKRIEAAQFAGTTHEKAAIEVELEVHRAEGDGVRGTPAR